MSQQSKKLSVGLVFDDSLDSNDGVAQYVKALGPWLESHGCQVSYFVGETKLQEWRGGQVYSLSKNMSVKFNGNRLSMPLWASKRALKTALRQEQPDILHVMVPYSPLMAKRLISLAPKSTVVVGTFHILPSGILSKVGSKMLGLWLRPSLRRFSAFASVSPAAAGFAKSAYGIDSKIIPNSVDTVKFKTEPPRDEGAKPRIVFLGRLVKRKGPAELIKAFTELSRTMPDTELVIAGNGPQRQKLEALVKKHGLSGSVKFLGFIEESAKPALLASADVACFPSLYGESFGIVLIEAMAAGSGPVLGGDNPGYRSVLGAKPELLVDPRDTAAFSSRLQRLLSDKHLSDELRQWQAQTVKQYDIDVVGAGILKMYREQFAIRSKKGNN